MGKKGRRREGGGKEEGQESGKQRHHVKESERLRLGHGGLPK